jgi:hypothetical protein
MKKLVCTLILLIPTGWASDDILINEKLSRKFVSTVKDAEIEKHLQQTSEFTECYKKNQFDPKNIAVNQDKIKAAEDCFKEKISKQKGKNLEALSDQLGLQSYGLIPNKNVNAITQYLADKMYKALTGIDRNEKANEEKLKFKNRKLIDQKVFIELYSNQLTKNALYEISRFCFQNLRNKNADPNSSTFATHWATFFNGEADSLGEITDTGNGSYGAVTTIDTSTKQNAYKDIFNNITNGTNLDANKLNRFFTLCSASIKTLCDKFKPENSAATLGAQSLSTGANACLAKARLQEIRKTLTNTDLIKKQFEDENVFASGITLETDHKGTNASSPNFYDYGRSNPNNNLDNLTNVSSLDLLEGGKAQGDEIEQLKNKCSNNPEARECESFLQIDDSRLQAEHAIDMDLRLKREVELARLREIKNGDQQSLEAYLEANGYLDLLAKVKNGEKIENIEEEVAKAIDSKRAATIEAIQQKLGKRQLSEDEVKDKDKAALIEENIEDVQQERARMAQVVLFNNIITSYISLSKKEGDKTVDLGRNVNAWKNEQQALEKAGIDSSLFEGLKEQSESSRTSTSNENSISGLTFLDTILGNGK